MSSTLITKIFPNTFKITKKDKKKEFPDQFIRFLRKYKKFREFEKKILAKKLESLPAIYKLEIKDKKLEKRHRGGYVKYPVKASEFDTRQDMQA